MTSLLLVQMLPSLYNSSITRLSSFSRFDGVVVGQENAIRSLVTMFSR